MVHAAEDSAFRKVALDVMERSAARRDALPPQPRSAAAAQASGHQDFGLGPHHSRRSAATWPKDQLKQVRRVALDGPEFLPALEKNLSMRKYAVLNCIMIIQTHTTFQPRDVTQLSNSRYPLFQPCLTRLLAREVDSATLWARIPQSQQ